MKNKKYYGEENDLNLKVVIGISRANQAIQKHSAVTFKEGGLTTAQFAVLEALYHKGTLTIQEIINSILSTGGNMTVVINNLEKEKLVERLVNPEDKSFTKFKGRISGFNERRKTNFNSYIKEIRY